MTPEKLESLILGTLGRVNSTYYATEKKSFIGDEIKKIPIESNEFKKPFPNIPSVGSTGSTTSLPQISDIPPSTLRNRNPQRPQGPYAGYFDEFGGFVWIDESGLPFARRQPVNYHPKNNSDEESN